MVLFEIHQRFKGHFLNELRVSFKKVLIFHLKSLFSKKTVLKNLLKFTGKNLYKRPFLMKLQLYSLQLYWKRDSSTGVYKIFQKSYSAKHLLSDSKNVFFKYAQ